MAKKTLFDASSGCNTTCGGGNVIVLRSVVDVEAAGRLFDFDNVRGFMRLNGVEVDGISGDCRRRADGRIIEF
jgi:hypothetical protein